MVVIGVVLFSAFIAFNQAQEYKMKADRAMRERDVYTRKLQANAQISADLRKLNESTIDQNTSTKLDVLRYMDLADDDIVLNESGETLRKVGRTNLYVRRFSVRPRVNVSYNEALRLADRMVNNPAVVVNEISLKVGKGYGDSTELEIRGTLYGLEKRD